MCLPSCSKKCAGEPTIYLLEDGQGDQQGRKVAIRDALVHDLRRFRGLNSRDMREFTSNNITINAV